VRALALLAGRLTHVGERMIDIYLCVLARVRSLLASITESDSVTYRLDWDLPIPIPN
jgi:hypothetical protein